MLQRPLPLLAGLAVVLTTAAFGVAVPTEPTGWPRTVTHPQDNPATAAKIELGKQLFFDPRLSGQNDLSCASCHNPEHAFADPRRHSKGHGGKVIGRNTPSCLNVAFFTTLMWDGRATSLESQALLPIVSPEEMNQDLDELERELNAVPGYVKQFRDVFGTPVQRVGIGRALAAFQRTLVSGPAPYDRYLAGDRNALSEDARNGMQLFFGEAGCAVCHKGPLFTDEKFHRIGSGFIDRGLGAITGKKEDNYKFRTPSLRNIAQTGPYMHDGSLATLEDVLFFYYRGVPKRSPDGLPLDVEPLVDRSFMEALEVAAFLKSLTGETPRITPPKLPE